MSTVFGVATEKEMRHLTQNVKLINAKEIALAHAINGTLTVLNSTRVATSQNRMALNTLNAALQSMTASLNLTDLKAAH